MHNHGSEQVAENAIIQRLLTQTKTLKIPSYAEEKSQEGVAWLGKRFGARLCRLANAVLGVRPNLVARKALPIWRPFPEGAVNAHGCVSCLRPFPMAWEDLTLAQELCLDLSQNAAAKLHLRQRTCRLVCHNGLLIHRALEN